MTDVSELTLEPWPNGDLGLTPEARCILCGCGDVELLKAAMELTQIDAEKSAIRHIIERMTYKPRKQASLEAFL